MAFGFRLHQDQLPKPQGELHRPHPCSNVTRYNSPIIVISTRAVYALATVAKSTADFWQLLTFSALSGVEAPTQSLQVQSPSVKPC